MMRADNLLEIQNREAPLATDRCDELEIYLNLARRVKVCGPNQLWIADITYVRLKAEFVYLAVVLDAFSRKVVGWSVDRTLQSRLPLRAVQKAIANRQPPPGLIPPFRPRCTIRLRRLHPGASGSPDDAKHESARESVRQGLCFTLHLLGTL
jgi:transposase InsO family protein